MMIWYIYGTWTQYTHLLTYAAILTEQYDCTQEDGNEGSGAEARRASQSFRVAQLYVALTVTFTHPHSKRASAALHGIVAIGDHHGNQVDALVKAAVGGSTGQDASSVIWVREGSVRGAEHLLLSQHRAE